MIDVFRVSVKEVSGLGPAAFADLMNMALQAEARSAGVLLSDVHTTMRLTDADLYRILAASLWPGRESALARPVRQGQPFRGPGPELMEMPIAAEEVAGRES